MQAVHFPSRAPATKPEEDQPPPPEGASVYDTILPSSISYRPTLSKNVAVSPVAEAVGNDPHDPPSAPEGVPVMPLVAFLEEGRSKETGWHRNQERRARGMFTQATLNSQLEPWERQLVRTKCHVE